MRKIYKEGGKQLLSEEKTWVTGKQLLEKTEAQNAAMPIIFCAAEDTSKDLLFFARLTSISIRDKKTFYEFERLTKIPKGHKKTELKIASSGKPISDNFIRSYAICQTPTFIAFD